MAHSLLPRLLFGKANSGILVLLRKPQRRDIQLVWVKNRITGLFVDDGCEITGPRPQEWLCKLINLPQKITEPRTKHV